MNRAKNAKNVDTIFLLKGRGSGKTIAAKDYIDKLRKINPNLKILIIRKKDLLNKGGVKKR